MVTKKKKTKTYVYVNLYMPLKVYVFYVNEEQVLF